MIRWRLYYGDGTTFSDEDGTPAFAPTTNVMCCAWYDDDNRRRLAHAADYYWYEDGRWYGSDLFGLWDYLARPGFKIVKFGRMIGDLQFRDVMSKAMNDLPLEGAAL
jgi:hypothetical protein